MQILQTQKGDRYNHERMRATICNYTIGSEHTDGSYHRVDEHFTDLDYDKCGKNINQE